MTRTAEFTAWRISKAVTTLAMLLYRAKFSFVFSLPSIALPVSFLLWGDVASSGCGCNGGNGDPLGLMQVFLMASWMLCVIASFIFIQNKSARPSCYLYIIEFIIGIAYLVMS